LVGPDVHQVERGSTISDHVQSRLVYGVVKSVKLAVVNAETVLPDVQHPESRFESWPDRGRAGFGFTNTSCLDTVAAENVAPSRKVARRASGGRALILGGHLGITAGQRLVRLAGGRDPV
jgi:hypothetical protein